MCKSECGVRYECGRCPYWCVDVCVEVLAVRVCVQWWSIDFFFFHIANVHHSMYYLLAVLLVRPSGDAVLTSCDRAEGVYREFRLSAGRL